MDLDVALFKQLLSTFKGLDEMHVIEEDRSIDPNDQSIFTNKERDANWLL